MTKTTRSILVAVLAVGLLGSGVAVSQLASAQTAGADILRDRPLSFDTPEIKRLTEISTQLADKSIAVSDRESLMAEAELIKKESTKNVDAQSRQTMVDKQTMISDYVGNNLATKSFENFYDEFPVSGIYVDDVTNQLTINIDAYKFQDDEVVKNTIQKVRSIVGSDVDLVIQPMPRIIPQCSQTGDCEPAQGGVAIHTSVGPCSVGFKASKGSQDGFVTAGHCTDGNTGYTVGQPWYVWWDHIGTVTANTYIHGEDADNAFVHADDGETISDKVFLNHDIGWAGGTAYGDGVTMEGQTTKGVSGVVVNSSYSGYVGSKWINDQAVTNYVGSGGDSGGTVYGYIPSDNFKGTHIGYNGYFSTYSKQANAISSISGLSWDFN